jgi:hypothetical protein
VPSPALPLAAVQCDTRPGRGSLALEDRVLSLLLIAAWAARTRRVLPPVAVTELSPVELVNFWADDQLEQPLNAPVHEWAIS